MSNLNALKCPQCGAPTDGKSCEYCKSIFQIPITGSDDSILAKLYSNLQELELQRVKFIDPRACPLDTIKAIQSTKSRIRDRLQEMQVPQEVLIVWNRRLL